MISIIIKTLLLCIVLFGVTLIYDAREIIKRFFSDGDQNEGALILKIIGFVIVVFASVILIFLK
jgi:hypothetical protein